MNVELQYYHRQKQIEVGDELVDQLDRAMEAYQIDPTAANTKRLEDATAELNAHTAQMAKEYGIKL